MTVQKAAAGLDFGTLRRAIEESDAELLAGLYADDAEVRIVNKDNPPSSPFELRGKEEIAEYLRDVRGRDIRRRVEQEVVGEDRVAFNEACEYPDGTRVLAAESLDLHDGKITTHVVVEAWDE